MAWQNDLALLRDRLKKLLQRPEVMQALATASPSLQVGIAIWKNDPDCKKGLQAERSLVRYFLRMAGRATPFGLLSGCSVGTVRPAVATEFALDLRQHYRTATRLDYDYLFALTSKLRSDPALQAEMHYGLNSSMHYTGSGWHYVESRLIGASRSHHLVKLSSDEYLDSVIRCARRGDCTFTQLALAIRVCSHAEHLTNSEIEDYLRQLVDSDILVPDILPLLTGRSSLDDLLDRLRELPSATKIYDTLVDIRESLHAFDRQPLGVTPQDYRLFANQLEALPAEVDDRRLLQVDMFKPSQRVNLGQAVLDEIYGALDILGRFSAPNEPAGLVVFRDAFTARYDQEWVSLVEALDPEMGIGYGYTSDSDGSQLLRGLPLGPPPGPYRLGLNEFQLYLMQKILDWAGTGRSELELQIADLPLKRDLGDLLPESFAVMASVGASSADAVEQGDFEIVFKGGTGPSCAKMLGRFCSADLELDLLVRAALREEESKEPEAVFAEIVYLPEGYIGNVLSRPALRDYEIVLLGRSGAPPERQITPDDLVLSIRNGKIVLYSRRLRRRVIPRMSNAHVYTRTALPPHYRLLCDLQNQGGLHVPSFSWGALGNLTALPRIRIGRIVLACAQWCISRAEGKALCDLDRYSAFLKIKALQQERGLPRWVLLSESDNKLPVDLDNPLSVDSLLHLLKRTPEVILMEMYPQPGFLCATGPEGNYVHELVIPLARKHTTLRKDSDEQAQSNRTSPDIDTPSDVSRNERFFPPGSDWQFVKIYGGPTSLDELLVTKIAPLIASLYANGAITRWFFIRYADPEPHIRLRFQSLDSAAYPVVADTLRSLLVEKGLWKIQCDTYRREIERYGGLKATLLSEEIFCADSEAVLAILGGLEGDTALDLRWRITLLGIDTLLTDCDLNLNDRRQQIGILRDSFISKFKLSSYSRRKIGDRFRAERTRLHAIMHGEFSDQNGDYQFAVQAFARRSEQTRPIIANLRVMAQKGALANDFFEIVRSYVHMHINRMIRASAQAHELILYEFLYRLYDSDHARKNELLEVAPEAVQEAL